MIGSRWIRLAIHTAIAAAALTSLPLADIATAATLAYDGVYRGEVKRTRGDESICGKAAWTVTYTIVNGQFSFVYDPARHVGVNLEVQADGSFSGSQQYMVSRELTRVKAEGHIVGNVLDADLDGMACGRHYHLTKTK